MTADLIARLEAAEEGSRELDNELVMCGCGLLSRLTQLSQDGHCPRCGFADDFTCIEDRAADRRDAINRAAGLRAMEEK